MKEKRWCACRVLLEADPDPKSIEHAVRVHQRQPEHRKWSDNQILEYEKTSGPNVPLGPKSPFVLKRVG